MIDSSALLAELKVRVRLLEADLRERSGRTDDEWATQLRAEYDLAFARERTALSWSVWRDEKLTLAAVSWIIACVFLRFCEDNGLLAGARDGQGGQGPWLSGPGVGRQRAVEQQTAFHAAEPTTNSRDWLHVAFGVLADLPAGAALLDRDHNPVWSTPISGAAADELLAFWRRADESGQVVHDFTDPELDTRFLGDLYQELSEHAKKTFALLQTPVFVERFILDHTLDPALAEFGLEGFKVIDPTCGSGHFLLGAFARLETAWTAHAPAIEPRMRVQRALDAIHGVDLNPFAIAISRFRLTVAALKAAGERTLTDAPAFGFHLAVGDALLRADASARKLDIGDEEDAFAYSVEDIAQYAGILDTGQYHVVVGNPPYITVKDKALNQRYRELYTTCSGKYALSVPFMELLFELAKKPDAAGGGAGYVGQITSNSFMKREFGKKVIEQFLSGVDPFSPVDLTHVIDTSGAYIPGHGTPTVILVGRRRKPAQSTVRAALGVRGEPGQPKDPARGKVWTEIVEHIDETEYDGTYVTITDLDRAVLANHPWSLAGGGAGELKEKLETAAAHTLEQLATEVGVMSVLGDDEPYEVPRHFDGRVIGLVVGDSVREYLLETTNRLWPYDDHLLPSPDSTAIKWLWPFRTPMQNSLWFGKRPSERGFSWEEYAFLARAKIQTALSIAWGEVATHNHFVLDRGGKVFNRTAPVIKLPAEASESEHFELLGVLNSSTACFWLKQVSFNKGDSTDSKGARVTGDPAFDTYQFNATKVSALPLPAGLDTARAQTLDTLAQKLADNTPAAALRRGIDLRQAQRAWEQTRQQMVAHQEELDWEVYHRYGLTEQNLSTTKVVPLEPQERAFELHLARQLAEGTVQTAWFYRHGRTAITELPTHWTAEYRDLVQARLDEMECNPWIRLLEQAKYKRRWAGASWDEQLPGALREALLDRLEARELWFDAQGRPAVRSVRQLAEELRRDDRARELAELLVGSSDVDYRALVADLVAGETVPHVAEQRYKPLGLEKFRAWQQVWQLQRAEDRGEKVSIPVPPKYGPGDFLKPTYWKARGKLDVPKERFIGYPGAALPHDDSEVIGWAGWDHAQRGQALLGLATTMTAEGAASEALLPLFAGFVELEPWLQQWHGDFDPALGLSPAAASTGAFEGLLAQHGVSRHDIAGWAPARPAGRTRARKATA